MRRPKSFLVVLAAATAAVSVSATVVLVSLLSVPLATPVRAQADIPDLVAGAMLQQRLLACAPLPVGEAELERVFRDSL